jgi:hypothetical protein
MTSTKEVDVKMKKEIIETEFNWLYVDKTGISYSESASFKVA